MVWRNIFEGRRLRFAFLLSLAANFFLLALGAAIYFERPRVFPPEAGRVASWMASNLSAEGETQFLEVFEKHRADIMAQQTAMRAAQDEFLAMVSDDEFDIAALQTKRKEMRDDFFTFILTIDGFMMEAVQQLSPDDRKRLADALPR